VPRKSKKRVPSGLPKFIRKHGRGYRAVVPAGGGEREPPSKVFPTVEAAVAWRDHYFAAKAAPEGRRGPLTLAAGLQLIIEYLHATDARAATETYYKNHARILFAGLGGETLELHNIGAASITGYVQKRRAAGVAASTIVGKELFVLRRMLKLARIAGYPLPPDPFVGLRLPKVRGGRFDVLTQDRVAQLVAAMRAYPRGKGTWHADLVELLFSTGLRRAELERLRVADIDMDAGRIRVDGKTGVRYQPFGRALEPVLRRLVAAAQEDGRLVVSYRTIEQLFRHWQDRLKEPRFSAHVIRHSYATAMASRVSPFELMALMGHRSLTQTSRYFHAGGESVREVLNSLQLGPPARARRTAAPSPPKAPPEAAS